jgi:predicted AAA+ superfamily ATPase
MWIERNISNKIKTLSGQYPAIALIGARQTGKSSLLKRLFPTYSFVSLDLPSHADLAETQPQEFIRQFPPPVVIDEVQYAPGLFRYLKAWIDENRHQYGQFILTGSQKFSLMRDLSESLAGRCALLELETLSVSEITKGMRSDIKLDQLTDLIIRGGFPDLHARPELDLTIFYESYVATYLERDVRSLLQTNQLRDFERFMRACALRSGQLLNKSELARDVGISSPTANEWLSVLHALNQITLLEPWFSNSTKSLVKSPKLYFADTGLLCFFLNISNQTTLRKSPLIGAIWETFVFSELRKQLRLKTNRADVHFWRSQTGLETDFLIHQGGRFSLYEAKFTERIDRKDIAKIEEVAEHLGSKNIDSMSFLAFVERSYPATKDIQVKSVSSSFLD